jgi:hypothetical protein
MTIPRQTPHGEPAGSPDDAACWQQAARLRQQFWTPPAPRQFQPVKGHAR